MADDGEEGCRENAEQQQGEEGCRGRLSAWKVTGNADRERRKSSRQSKQPWELRMCAVGTDWDVQRRDDQDHLSWEVPRRTGLLPTVQHTSSKSGTAGQCLGMFGAGGNHGRILYLTRSTPVVYTYRAGLAPIRPFHKRPSRVRKLKVSETCANSRQDT
ncbi:hypothetical protein CIB48_g890 [Xylaria polymorpha]|nr:hypothetical protein CIB48_g890 [Xylaria polymorpha]